MATLGAVCRSAATTVRLRECQSCDAYASEYRSSSPATLAPHTVLRSAGPRREGGGCAECHAARIPVCETAGAAAPSYSRLAYNCRRQAYQIVPKEAAAPASIYWLALHSTLDCKKRHCFSKRTQWCNPPSPVVSCVAHAKNCCCADTRLPHAACSGNWRWRFLRRQRRESSLAWRCSTGPPAFFHAEKPPSMWLTDGIPMSTRAAVASAERQADWQ